MKKEITNEQLWIVEMDIQNIVRQSPALALFNDNRFRKFFSDNAMSLKILHTRIHEIQKKYIVHDEKGVPVHAEATEGGQKDWQYLESVVAKNGELLTGELVKEAYLIEYKEFANRSVTVLL